MSDLKFNKIAGAVLATGLALVGLKELSGGVFAPQEVEKPGYLVEVAAEEGAGGGAAEAPIDWGTVLPTADIAAGEAAFNKCKSCHTVDAGGANGTGPNLFGVVGRKPAGHGGFAYSQAMTDLGGRVPVWNDPELSAFLAAPQKYLPGTKMTFVGLKKAEDRINIIAYLRSKGGTLPVPAPNPAAAAAPAAGVDPNAAPAPGAAAEGQPTATGSTATPATGAGGPAGQGTGAPAPGAPSEQRGASAASPTASGNSRQ
ncbi:cytochrome c family protein [Phenylobacterium sp.]|jgi:cytochrome c|uniref:c-type cytochrome n=1 Tax=Phenylobacterium sp. TaxID=1871053 RepID=UPI002F94BC3C